MLNLGIDGNRVLNESAGPAALARFDRDVLAAPGVTHVFVLEGINDMGISSLPERRVASDGGAAHRRPPSADRAGACEGAEDFRVDAAPL